MSNVGVKLRNLVMEEMGTCQQRLIINSFGEGKADILQVKCLLLYPFSGSIYLPLASDGLRLIVVPLPGSFKSLAVYLKHQLCEIVK